MDTAVVIPVVSIVTSAAVAVGVPWVNGRRDDRRAERQTNNTRVDELRGVLEEAGLALNDAILTLASTEAELKGAEVVPAQLGSRIVRPTAQEAMKRADAAHRAVQRSGNRIAIRLGPNHFLSTTYELGRAEIFEALRVLGFVYTSSIYDDEAQDQFRRHVETALTAGGSFLEVSASAIGPEVPVDDEMTAIPDVAVAGQRGRGTD